MTPAPPPNAGPTRIALSLATALTLAGTAVRAETWDMPMAYPESNFHTAAGKAFAQCVGEASGGEPQIIIHANGSLFKGNEIKRAVETWQAPIGERLLSAHENENAVFGFDAVPFLATSFEEPDKLWAAARPTLEKVLAEQDMVLVYAVPWPPQGLYARKAIEKAADLEGVKFRAYNVATARMAEMTGAVPVQIESAELAQALTTGVAESFISSGSTGNDMKVWESLTHFYDVNAWLPRNYVLANKDAYDALDDGGRKALTDCSARASERGKAEARKLTAQYLDVFRERGMTVTPPGPELERDLAAIGQTMTSDWLAKAGADDEAILAGYKKE